MPKTEGGTVKIGNVSSYLILSILVYTVFGCSTVSKIRPGSYRDSPTRGKVCVKAEYEYSRNSYSKKDDFSYKQEVQKMTTILNSVIKNYGIETSCEKFQRSYLISINKTSPFTVFSWYTLWGAASSVTLGLIPFYEPFEMSVIVSDVDKKNEILKIQMEFEAKFSTFNTENSKRISRQNNEDYGEPEHTLAPIGASIATAILKDFAN